MAALKKFQQALYCVEQIKNFVPQIKEQPANKQIDLTGVHLELMSKYCVGMASTALYKIFVPKERVKGFDFVAALASQAANGFG